MLTGEVLCLGGKSRGEGKTKGMTSKARSSAAMRKAIVVVSRCRAWHGPPVRPAQSRVAIGVHGRELGHDARP
jgi:hypothetical protein